MENTVPEKGSILAITKADQYRTVDELFARSQSSSSYYTLLILSAFIITAGLLVNNSSIVIGGMLVTPVLTPLLMVGLGLAIGEPDVIRNVAGLIVKSFALVFAIAILLTLLFGSPPQAVFENTLRVAVLYFIVALAAGISGAFAWARKEISEVLPGIAIAVSLVPPLGLAGIWIAEFQFDIARFYFLVFLFNIIGIIFGSLIVFSLLKFYKMGERIQKKVEQAKVQQETAKARNNP